MINLAVCTATKVRNANQNKSLPSAFNLCPAGRMNGRISQLKIYDSTMASTANAAMMIVKGKRSNALILKRFIELL